MTLEYALYYETHIVTVDGGEAFWFSIQFRYGLYWLGVGYKPKLKRYVLISKSELIEWLGRVSE